MTGKAIIIVAVLALAVSPTLADTFYTNSWDFNNDPVGGPAAGWTSYTPWWATPNPGNAVMKIYNSSQYVSGSGMPIFDSNKFGASLNSNCIAAKHVLSEAEQTNTFIFQTEMFTDLTGTGITNWLSGSGIKLQTSWNGVADAGEIWFEPDTDSGSSKNIRTGSSGGILPTQDGFTGGNRRLLVNDGLNGLDNVLANTANTLVKPATIQLRVKYNTPDNPGTVEYWVKTQDYISLRDAYADSQGWIKMSWKGSSGQWHDSVSLALDPLTGEYAKLTTINLQVRGWTHTYFDDVALLSVPEPATLSLLALGALAMVRRRRV